MTVTTTGQNQIHLTEFSMKVYENWKTTKVSLYDAFFKSGKFYPEDDVNQSYDSDYETNFKDPYVAFNLLEKLNIITTSESWYGTNSYYTWDIMN